jgi:hypothetical protein
MEMAMFDDDRTDPHGPVGVRESAREIRRNAREARRDFRRRMRRGSQHGPAAKGIFGLTLITVGVLLLLDRMGLVEVGPIAQYWPLIPVAWGLAAFVDGRLDGGAFWMTVGGVFLVANFTDYSIRDLWPILIVVAGLGIFWGAVREREVPADDEGVSDGR